MYVWFFCWEKRGKRKRKNDQGTLKRRGHGKRAETGEWKSESEGERKRKKARRRDRCSTETCALGLQSLDSGAPGLESYPLGFSRGGRGLAVVAVGAVLELVASGTAIEAKLITATEFLLLGR